MVESSIWALVCGWLVSLQDCGLVRSRGRVAGGCYTSSPKGARYWAVPRKKGRKGRGGPLNVVDKTKSLGQRSVRVGPGPSFDIAGKLTRNDGNENDADDLRP